MYSEDPVVGGRSKEVDSDSRVIIVDEARDEGMSALRGSECKNTTCLSKDF